MHLACQLMSNFSQDALHLVLLDNWSVWPSGQRMHIFERFRKSYDETRQLIDAPGHIFQCSEMEISISLVCISVLFLWDCYVVVPDSPKLLFFSHDAFGVGRGIESHTAGG